MLTNDFIEKLKILHNDGGKHSNYQNFPVFLSDKLGIKADIDEDWRGDSARFRFIEENLCFENEYKILDIGSNTGRFCLDLAYKHRNSIFYAYELNKNYIEYINLIKNEFNLNNIYAEAISVGLNDICSLQYYNIIFHMNVLHHAGVDFDVDTYKSFSNFKDYSIEYLSKLSKKCSKLVFQMGYNHGGNKNNPIVKPYNINEMLNLEINIFKESNFRIEKIAIYNSKNKKYMLTEENRITDDLFDSTYSEFYRRPMFILKSI